MRKKRGLAALAAGLALLGLSGCAPLSYQGSPAAGGYNPYNPAVMSTEVDLLQSFEASPQETHDYWSDPAMFAGANPFEYTDPDNGLPVGVSDPATGAFIPPTDGRPLLESTAPYPDTTTAQLFDRNGLAGSTQGRLYMDFSQGQFVCSGTVINTAIKTIVITAAHCLMATDGSKEIAKSVIFVPGDRNHTAEAPYGMWAAVDYLIPQEFYDGAGQDANGSVSGEGWVYDFAYLVMEVKDGVRIQDVTGGQGISFGVPVPQIVQIGYPAGAPFDGSDEYMCVSSSWKQGAFGGYHHQCDMTGGSSGGGYFAYYDPGAGSGYIVSVNSYGSKTHSAGPALGEKALAMYKQVAGGADQ